MLIIIFLTIIGLVILFFMLKWLLIGNYGPVITIEAPKDESFEARFRAARKREKARQELKASIASDPYFPHGTKEGDEAGCTCERCLLWCG